MECRNGARSEHNRLLTMTEKTFTQHPSCLFRGSLNEKVADSPLFRDQSSWSSGILKSAHGTPDDWLELQKPTALQPDAQVLDLVRGIRHALAHGNVLSQSGCDGQISQLVFVFGGDRGIPARYIMMNPSDLHRFLDCWFNMIEHLPLP
jgi:hypothetical protein